MHWLALSDVLRVLFWRPRFMRRVWERWVYPVVVWSLSLLVFGNLAISNSLGCGSAHLNSSGLIPTQWADWATSGRIWLRADQGITLGSTMALTGVSTAVLTLSGTLTQAIPVYVISDDTGKAYWSLDGGATQTGPVTLTTTPLALGGSGISLAKTSGAFTAPGAIYRATVASWTSSASDDPLNPGKYVFSQATATKQPVLDRSQEDGQLSLLFDGIDDSLSCTTAGVVAWIAGNDLAHTVYAMARPTDLTNGGTIVGAGSSTNATAQWRVNTNSTPSWQWLAEGDTTPAVNNVGGTPVINTTYRVEAFSDGTHATLKANGTTVINNAGMDTATKSTIDRMTIGCKFVNNVASNTFPGHIGELVIFTADVHATASQLWNDYAISRYVPIPSTVLSPSFFFDNFRPNTQGTIPISWAPNDYPIRDAMSRLVLTGTGNLDVTAIPVIQQTQSLIYSRTVAVWSDNVSAATLTYGGSFGFAQTQTYVPADGLTHTVELETTAEIVRVSGNYTLTPASKPTNYVVGVGDSLTYGFAKTTRIAPWPNKLRRAIRSTGSGYGVNNYGISGQRLNDYCSSAPLQAAFVADMVNRFSGVTGKKILVLWLGTNDWDKSTPLASFTSQIASVLDAIHAADSAIKIEVLGPVRRFSSSLGADTTANTDGHILADYDSALSTAVSTRTSFCHYTSMWTVLTTPTSTAAAGDYVDGTHPNDNADLTKLLPVIQAAVLAW